MLIDKVTSVRLSVGEDQPPAFSFTLKVSQLLELGRIDRLADTKGGVQRRQSSRHIENIVKDVSDNQAPLPQNVICEISGDFRYDESRGHLDLKAGSYLSLLDGGSRLEAFRTMPVKLRNTMDVQVVAYVPLTLEQRRIIFETQTKNRKVDQRHLLALKHATGAWVKPQDQEIYELCLMLNGDDNSPLCGKISFQEEERAYSARHRPDGANVVGLIPTFRKVFGPTSPLGRKSQKERQQYVQNVFAAARKTWPGIWDSNSHILTTSRGIRSLLLLITNSPAYTMYLGKDLSADRIHEAVELARTFNWSADHNKGKTVEQIVTSLNQSIARKVHA